MTKNTVLLYKVKYTQAIDINDTAGFTFTLAPFEGSAEVQGYDDGGALYELPEGYSVGELQDGSKAIFDRYDHYCPVSAYGHTPKVNGRLLPKIQGERTVKTWLTGRVKVEHVERYNDTALPVFNVSDMDGTPLGTITPIDAEQMFDIIDELDLGRCPIAEAWEDGQGNTCTMEGWGGPIGEGDHLEVKGHRGTWYVIDQSRFNRKRIYLLEHEKHGDTAPCIIVDQDLNVLADEVQNGFEDLEGWEPAK